MNNPNTNRKNKEPMELKRMKEEIATALKKALPDIAKRLMKQTTTRRFCVR